MDKQFYHSYVNELTRCYNEIDHAKITSVVNILRTAYSSPTSRVFVCGNGGSAAIAEHAVCDHTKGINTASRSRLWPRVVSLSSNMPLITAIANDFDYTSVFGYQLELEAKPHDVLWLISSSGNSLNIIRALEVGASIGMPIVGITGFQGGEVKRLIPDTTIHIPSTNYGVIEDVTQSLMHMISQSISSATFKE